VPPPTSRTIDSITAADSVGFHTNPMAGLASIRSVRSSSAFTEIRIK
jgi:hypothetical protein